MAKHVHADLIKAWAEGAEIEYWSPTLSKWLDCSRNIYWDILGKYRVKPEPHKWQAVIDAWKAGKTVQWQSQPPTHGWSDGAPTIYALVGMFDQPNYNWRIKPESTVQYWYFDTYLQSMAAAKEANLKLTFEEGKLVKSEVLK